MKKDLVKKRISGLVSRFSPSLFFRIAYIHNRKRWPSFTHPKDISEIWIKYLFDGKPQKYYCLADKYLVRDYVKDRGLNDILVPLIGVWNSSEEIDFDSLPDKFALKMNFGAGMNIICTGKRKFDKEAAQIRLDKWMNIPYKYSHSEMHYNLIDRKIICEAFIEDSNGKFPTDYKFICINGIPYCILACFGRETGHADYMPFTLDWKPLPEYNKNGICYDVECPKNLKKMIEMAKELSEGLELVRVDLYDTGDKVIFGEMTLTPAGCIFHTWSQKALDDMGDFYYETLA